MDMTQLSLKNTCNNKGVEPGLQGLNFNILVFAYLIPDCIC